MPKSQFNDTLHVDGSGTVHARGPFSGPGPGAQAGDGLTFVSWRIDQGAVTAQGSRLADIELVEVPDPTTAGKHATAVHWHTDVRTQAALTDGPAHAVAVAVTIHPDGAVETESWSQDVTLTVA